jgi:peptidoglycan hydrolase-like protein with peptidoglycan-binding domain
MVDSVSSNIPSRTFGMGLPDAAVATADVQPSVLRLGSMGAAVKELQQQLVARGEQLPANGQFGPRTLEAVRRFQLANGIRPADGIAGPKTRAALAAGTARGGSADTFRAAAPSQRAPVSLTSPATAPAPPESVLLKTGDGRSLTVEQALDLLNQANAKAQRGGLGNKVTSFLTGGALGEAFASRDQLVGAVNKFHESLLRKGYLTLDDRQKLGRRVSDALATVGEVEGIRSDVVETVTDAGTGAVLVAATVLSGGTAAPLTLSAAAGLGATGAAARVGIKGALEGENYSVRGAVQDAALGGAQGATSLVGAGLGGKVASSVGGVAARLGGQVVGSAAKAATAGAIQGGVGGATAGAAETAVRSDTWDKGVAAGLKKTAVGAAAGAASGAVGGGVLGAAGGIFRPKVGVTLAAEESSLRQAKDSLVRNITGEIRETSQGKVSEQSIRDFLDAYSQARALPETGTISPENLKLFKDHPAAGGRLFKRAEEYFDLNQQHIQAIRRVQDYGQDTSVLATFETRGGKLKVTAGQAPDLGSFGERFSAGYVEDAYRQDLTQSGRAIPTTPEARFADRQRWYRESWLGKSADDSEGWRQSRAFVGGSYEAWRATQAHLEANGLNFLGGTFKDGEALVLRPGTEVTFQRLGRAENLGSSVRSIFLGADQGQGAVELKNAIDPSFTGGAAYTHQAEYSFRVPPDADWVLIRGRIQGTGALRPAGANGSLVPDIGGAEQVVIWDRRAQAPVVLADAGVDLRQTRLDPIARSAPQH